ncbi:ribonuclease Z, mitochondrial [Anopheles stephensi]|uniref:ribonuclease Z, mitochondrial n=1 Tax=Anopheles stephensi TaxID=30069 RepID=UPI0016588F98|nr:ribonuclease Z, mitochondrial [Anopheles stephensi]
MYTISELLNSHVVRSIVPKRWNSSHKKLHNVLSKMPLDPKHIAEAQKQRLKLKQKVSKVSPGIVNLQVLGCGAPGAPASVYLFTDQTRYLFNCGEGTQRLAYEHKTKLSCLENIFMTRTNWERIGGLPGICLTMQDVGVPAVSLHGPPGLDELFKAMRRFVILKDMKVEASEYATGDVYEDHVMTLRYVVINRDTSECKGAGSDEEQSQEEAPVDDTDYYAYERKKEAPPQTQSETTKSARTTDWTKREETSVMAYICKLKPRHGQLSLERCVDFGVPPGPLLGQLKNGNDVTLPDGRVVKSADVRAPDDPGPVFMFIDIPSREYLKDFMAKGDVFAKYQQQATDEADQAIFVVHFTPVDVMRCEEYRQFMDRFSASTRHIALNEVNNFSGYIAAHRIQYHLNQLDEQIFPLLREENNEYNDPPATDPDLVRSSSLSYMHIRPPKGIDRAQEASLNASEYLSELELLPDFKEALEALKQQMVQHNERRSASIRAEQFPRLIFLGTGSSIPNKTRNVSAILILTSNQSSILLDCGEGTVGQIWRFFGKTHAEAVLRSIKAVYISHLHADHHLGLIGLLQARKKLFGDDCERLTLFAPEQISYWLRLYDCRFESIHKDYTLVKNADLLEQPFKDERLFEMGIQEIATCRVRHCPHSFGVALKVAAIGTHPDTNIEGDVKITYSGDTMPCESLIALGRDSTVLIHEATMEDELAAEARIKMHSTLSQAIEQGRKMNARYTLLTHFSQRYAKIPRLRPEQQQSGLGTDLGIAFDNMEVTLDDLPTLCKFYPALKAMFISHFEEMEQKAIKRGNKKLRLETVKNGTGSKECSPTR